jgi:hypothetical protein
MTTQDVQHLPRTFIDEQTGERYRILDWDATHVLDDGRFDFDKKVTAKLEKIIEPRLEVGDWVYHKRCGMFEIHEHDLKEELIDLEEIRKASGEVWQKENGQWKKR